MMKKLNAQHLEGFEPCPVFQVAYCALPQCYNLCLKEPRSTLATIDPKTMSAKSCFPQLILQVRHEPTLQTKAQWSSFLKKQRQKETQWLEKKDESAKKFLPQEIYVHIWQPP